MTIRDGRDDVYDSGGGLKKIVTIVTDRHGDFREGNHCKGCNAFAYEKACGTGFLNGGFRQDDGIFGFAEIRAEKLYSAVANEV